MEKIRLMLVDDDPDWISAMRLFLQKEEGMEIVATAISSEDAKTAIRGSDVDVVLMDIHMSSDQYDGIYAAAEILLQHAVKIIMLTSLREEKCILDSFAAGAVNYVNKEEYQDIPRVIRSAYLTSTAAEVLLKDYARLREQELLQELTPSEKEVVELIDQGYSRHQIQDMLFKSESTLKNHINRLLKKLGVKNTKEAIRKIKLKGLMK